MKDNKMFDMKTIGEVLLQLDGLEYATTDLAYRFYEKEITEEEYRSTNSKLKEQENKLVTDTVDEKYIYDGCICERLHFNELFWSEYYEAKGGK
jgi:hypothetical protein